MPDYVVVLVALVLISTVAVNYRSWRHKNHRAELLRLSEDIHRTNEKLLDANQRLIAKSDDLLKDYGELRDAINEFNPALGKKIREHLAKRREQKSPPVGEA